jgi:hypothetical protein
LPAGDATRADPGTVNGRIVRRLQEYARIRRGEPRGTRRRPPPAPARPPAKEDDRK